MMLCLLRAAILMPATATELLCADAGIIMHVTHDSCRWVFCYAYDPSTLDFIP